MAPDGWCLITPKVKHSSHSRRQRLQTPSASMQVPFVPSLGWTQKNLAPGLFVPEAPWLFFLAVVIVTSSNYSADGRVTLWWTTYTNNPFLFSKSWLPLCSTTANILFFRPKRCQSWSKSVSFLSHPHFIPDPVFSFGPMEVPVWCWRSKHLIGTGDWIDRQSSANVAKNIQRILAIANHPMTVPQPIKHLLTNQTTLYSHIVSKIYCE